MRIGFLDSGIGGIWALKEAVKALPRENYIYYADTRNAPYGTKSSDEVKKIVHAAVESMIRDFKMEMLVIACNTATSVAIGSLRGMYGFPVVGMEPAVKPAIEICHDSGKRVLVLATELTLQEERFRKLVSRVDTDEIVDCLAMQDLVAYADGFDFDGPRPEEYIRSKFKNVDLARYGTVVLGCTHFTYFKDLFQRILPAGTFIIDGTEGIVKRIRSVTADCAGSETGTVEFISTDPEKIDAEELRRIYDSI